MAGSLAAGDVRPPLSSAILSRTTWIMPRHVGDLVGVALFAIFAHCHGQRRIRELCE
jgi:hypothetical protein